MKCFFKFSRFILVFFLTISLLKIQAQDSAPLEPISIEKQYANVLKSYGTNQTLVSGKFYENIYRNDLGHPFFFRDEFQPGHLVIHTRRFDNVKLMYNIYDQNIVALYTDNSNLQIAFQPPVNFISEFSINTINFRKYNFDGQEDKFYQVVYSGRIKCLFFWLKKRQESHHNRDFSAYEYSSAQKKSYLVIDNKLNRFKSKSSLLKLFPEEHKAKISAFMKEKRIKPKKVQSNIMAELIMFCESLLVTKPIH